MLLKRPTVSVIIPSYNHQKFVDEAVRSVLEQDFSDMEVIVVDDGSSDATPDKVAAIHDGRLKLIRLPTNRIEHPRNLALKMAKGKYIAFQNSDDIWLPGKLRAQIAAMRADKRIVASFTGVELIDVRGKPLSGSWLDGIYTTENRSARQWQRRFFDLGNCLCISSAVVRQSAIRKTGGFRPSLYQLPDLDLWVRLAAVGNFKILKKNYTKMRLRPENLSYPTPEAHNRTSIEYTEVLKRFLEPPLIHDALGVFGTGNEKRISGMAEAMVILARRALDVGTPGHRRFADFTLSKIMDDPDLRQAATETFGRQIVVDFLENRGVMETKV